MRPKILVMARFQWMLSRIRRVADLRSVLDRAAGGLIIDEFVMREIAAQLSLLPLLPPHEDEPSPRIILIDLDAADIERHTHSSDSPT